MTRRLLLGKPAIGVGGWLFPKNPSKRQLNCQWVTRPALQTCNTSRLKLVRHWDSCWIFSRSDIAIEQSVQIPTGSAFRRRININWTCSSAAPKLWSYSSPSHANSSSSLTHSSPFSVKITYPQTTTSISAFRISQISYYSPHHLSIRLVSPYSGRPSVP